MHEIEYISPIEYTPSPPLLLKIPTDLLSVAAREVSEQHPQHVQGSQTVVQVASTCKPNSALETGVRVEADRDRMYIERTRACVYICARKMEAGGGGCTRVVDGCSRRKDHRPSHLHNAGKEHVGLSRTMKTSLAPSVRRRGVFGESHEGRVASSAVRKNRL